MVYYIDMASSDASPPRDSCAFLLAQVGAHAAQRFAERLEPLGLTPPLAGVLRLVAQNPAMNQSNLADRLGTSPSWIVALVDDLEERGLLSRTRSSEDRRVQELRLTSGGREVLAEVAEIARAHDRELTAALTRDQERQLHQLLSEVALAGGLSPGVHPGYRNLGRPEG